MVLGLLLVLTGCSLNPFDRGPKLEFISNPISLEYGKVVDPKEFVKKYTADEIFIGEYDPFTVGEQSIVYTLIRNGKEIEYTLTINITDTQNPRFTKKTEDILIMEGGTFDVKNYFEAFHDVDGKVPVTLLESFDSSKPGVHVMTAQAKNKNGNISTTNFTLAIKSKEEYEQIVANVTPKPAEENTQENTADNSGGNSSAGNSNSGNTSSGGTYVEPERPQPVQKPSNKSFMFSDGYNIQTGLSACTAYIGPYSQFERACVDIRNGDGIGIGYEAQFY